MFVSCFSLAVLLIGLMLVFYTFIFIYDIPCEIAKKRNHSQAEAIHVACWLSLFTLHAIGPIVYLWAIAKPLPLRVAMESAPDNATLERIAALEERLRTLEGAKIADDEAAPDLPERFAFLEAADIPEGSGRLIFSPPNVRLIGPDGL